MITGLPAALWSHFTSTQYLPSLNSILIACEADASGYDEAPISDYSFRSIESLPPVTRAVGFSKFLKDFAIFLIWTKPKSAWKSGRFVFSEVFPFLLHN
jgi:hypothetical protein